MARRSQCSDAGDNPLDPNYLHPHYREEYRLAIDRLVEDDLEGYYKFLQGADVVDFLSLSEIDFIQNSVQLPNQSSHPEHPYLNNGADGSSDTYWPLHSDLDAPGLDLGWPQIHHFIGPAEVTTLVNPAAPDMPSIKEQARRLIKNAQMVIAVVMDMFTDVDIFADILNAAMRNVPVYILLDEANVQHFVNMVNNCRVDLNSIQSLRVRTVSGITYHCRTGKSFKGQMLDRFLLTDCRAVLSGNYSFMWSYEKLHRCMAHLFLGQLVSTFDEEFRILYALSEPLIIENLEDLTVLQKQPYPSERPMLSDIRKYRSMDPGPPEEWPRQVYDERMEVDRRMMPLKRQETFHGPMDIYGRFQTPQTRLEPPFEQGPPRLPIMEGLTHKRHSFAEGAPGRYNLPFQQRVPDVEPQGWPFYRGQKHHQPGLGPGQGPEPDYDKFWNQDFQDQYPEPGFLPEVQPRENFDPVLNYLSSTRNVDIDQSSDKLLPAPDLAFGTGHPRRHGIGQPYACQTSPTPSNTTEKKFLQEHTSDRKDPTVKRGLRNWRISSFLSAYENTEEPEGLPMAPLQTSDPFEEPPYPTLRQTPPLGDIAVSKIPNVREFKVPTLPRASQMPAFTKLPSRELPKKPPDEPLPVVVVPETKATPSPSESSSTTDGDKQEEPEQKEPKASALRREESFRRKYNAAVQRSSRLRSSLIFSSLDQENKTAPGEPDEDGTKTESEQTKLPFVSQVLAQRRPATREPFEWRSYIKTNDKSNDDSNKATEKDTGNKMESLSESQETVKPQDVAPKVSVPLPHSSEPPPTQPSQFLISQLFIDMNDPDQRFLFFKELAAKRKAAEAEKAKQKPESTTSTTVKKDEPAKEEIPQKGVAGPSVKKQDTLLTEESKKTEDVSGQTNKLDSVVKTEPTSTQSCEKIETKASTDSEKMELKESQASTKTQTQEKQPTQDRNLSNPAVKLDKPPVATTQANVEQVTEEKTTPDTTSNELKTSRSVPDFNKQIGLDVRSSHRSPRIYQRSASHSQDAPSPGAALKESQQKSRLWTPTLPRREPLKPFGDSKLKCISTVIQIEEPTEERTQTSASDSASTTPTLETVTEEKSGVKSQPKQSPKEGNIVQSTAGLTPSKESVKEHAQSHSLTSIETPAKEKSTVSTPISDKAQLQQPLNEALVKSNVSERSKETTQLPTSVESTARDKSTVLPFISDNTQPLNEKSLVKFPSGVIQVKEGDKEFTQCKPVAPVESPVQEKPTVSPQESQSESPASVEPPSHDKPKLEPKQSHTQTVKEKSTSGVAQAADKSDKPPSMSEKAGPEQSVKESAEETVQITKNNQETIEGKTEESTSDKIEEESVSQSAEKAKRKSSIIPAEEVTQLESHSNTSSPTSFATALESISSEETDMLSPGRSDTQHLFRRSESDFHSNVSDTSSDFETPCSDLSKSPMLSMTNIDEAYRVSSDGEYPEDNISIAETVIEVAPMDIPASTEDVKADIGSTSPPAAKEADVDTLKSEENQPPQEHPPPETSSNPSAAQSEAKTPTQDAPTEPSPPGSDHLAQNETAQSNADVKIDTNPEPTQTKLNKASAESSVPSPVTEKTKPLDKTPEAATESSRKEASGPSEKSQTEVGKETESMDVKAQDLKASNSDSDPKVVSAITQAESDMSSVEGSTSPATQETKVADKTLESNTKEASGSTEKSQSEVSKESHSTDVKTQDSESPTCPATSQVTEEKQEVDKTPEITTKETSKATSPDTQQTKVADKTLERSTKEASGSTEKSNVDSPSEVRKESADSAKTSEDKKINATTTGELEIKPESDETQTESNKASVESQTTPATSQVTEKTKMAEKTPEMTKSSTEKSNIESQSEVSKESHTTSEAINSDTDAKAVPSKTQTESNSAPKHSSGSSQVKQEANISDKTPDITPKGPSKPADERSKDTQHKSKETHSTDTTVNAQDIETATKSVSPGQIRQNKPADVKAEEKAPPPSQPKQSKPVQSRYLSSTANVISSSNLRDDTKILLEQISANSQSRNESNKEAPVTDDEKEDEADKNGKHKTDRLSQQKPIQEREKLLERIQSMRKDRKVYSRFEL